MRFLIPVLASLLTISCATSTPKQGVFREWREEVFLNDGRVITVKQKWRCDRIGKDKRGEYCTTMRESWLTISLPEFSNHDIEWNEQLWPVVLNVDKGQLYIVGIADGGQFLIYGKPRPPYVGYRWNINQWQRISFSEIPEAIYKTNMATALPPDKSPQLFKLEAKDRLNSAPTLSKSYRRILPDYKIEH